MLRACTISPDFAHPRVPNSILKKSFVLKLQTEQLSVTLNIKEPVKTQSLGTRLATGFFTISHPRGRFHHQSQKRKRWAAGELLANREPGEAPAASLAGAEPRGWRGHASAPSASGGRQRPLNHASRLDFWVMQSSTLSKFRCGAEPFFPSTPPACRGRGAALSGRSGAGRTRCAWPPPGGRPHRARGRLIRTQDAPPARALPAACICSHDRRPRLLPSAEDQVHDPLQLINSIME